MKTIKLLSLSAIGCALAMLFTACGSSTNYPTSYTYEVNQDIQYLYYDVYEASEIQTAFDKAIGYDGIFLSNHFLDGNINPEARKLPYPEQIAYYFRDYEDALAEGKRIGLKVFPAVELSFLGTDFLIYGLDSSWYLAHPEIMRMEKTAELSMMRDAGALIVQAHPYREDSYIDHIRLFPRSVHAVETLNSCQPDLANEMAALYASRYNLLTTCGSDNHWAGEVFDVLRRKGLEPAIAGMSADEPLESVEDYIRLVKAGQMRPFLQREPEPGDK